MKNKFPKTIAVTLEEQSNPDENYFVVHDQAADAANLGTKVEVAIYDRREVGVITTQTHYAKKK